LTDCREIEPLIEKLWDGEASADEKRAAETHLATCRDCRLHLEFLVSTGELARRPLPEPPESYWELVPRRVLARIEDQPARGWFSSFLFAPSTLRWGALGATLIVVAAVSLTVVRETSRPGAAPSAPPMAAPPEPPAQPEAPGEERARTDRRSESPSALEPPSPAAPETSPPPMARDEATVPPAPKPEPRTQEDLVVDRESERVPHEEEARVAVPAGAAPASRAMVATRKRREVEDCAELRELVASAGERQLADARHALALCSLSRFEETPTDDLRSQAIQDAESFLALESEGPRADEIRERKRLLEK
jgi:hypothetical protein